uniref:glutaminase n=1 Tax=Panagrolaimus superbus TaxID=310955 RepID=A0A914ZC76_9BILA
MYDYSGQFAFHVGLPAKSGVSGLLIVVIPNLVGIALWSPPLDKMGNSCRGVAFCKELINRFNFHTYDSISHNESQKFDPRKRVGDREKDVVVSLLFSSKAGDLNTVRRMYMQGNDLECPDYDKRTALHLAASEGHAEIVRFLLQTAKVRPDPKDRWNRTPLKDAKAGGHTACINLLQKSLQLSEECHKEEEEEEEEEEKEELKDEKTHHSQQCIKAYQKMIYASSPTTLPSKLPLYLQLNPLRQTSIAATIHSTESSSSSDEDEEEEDFRIRLEQKQKELKAYGICRNYSGTFSDSNNV